MGILRLLILITAEILIVSCDDNLCMKDSNFNCVLDYIIKNDYYPVGYVFANVAFKKIEGVQVIKEECDKFIDQTLSNVYSSLVLKEKNLHVKSCVVYNLKEKTNSALLLKNVTLEFPRNITELSEARYLWSKNMFKNAFDGREEYAASLCNFEEFLSKYFANLVDQWLLFSKPVSQNQLVYQKDEIEKTNYCLRKHYVDNGFIDKNEYPVVINPNNLDVTNVNCTNIILKRKLSTASVPRQLLFQNFMTAVSTERLDCYDKAFLKHQYYEWTIYVEIFAEIPTLTFEQNRKIRDKFLKQTSIMTTDIVRCLA